MARKNGWFKVWNCILTDNGFFNLTNAEAGVWLRLAALMSQEGDQYGRLDITPRMLAINLQINQDDLQAVMAKLPNVEVQEDQGTLHITMTKWRKWQQNATAYQRLKRYRDRHRDCEQESPPEPEEVAPPKPVEPETYSEDFESFWKAYPKKIGKGGAWKSWKTAKKARKLPKIEILLQSLGEWKGSEQWTKEHGQFIPNPQTWINQSRWEDEVPKRMGGPTW